MNAGLSSRRRSEGVGNKTKVVGSVWERRIKIDEVKGGVKVFNGSDEVLEEKMDTDSFRSDACHGYKASRSGHLSGNRKTWNQSGCFHGFSQTQVSENCGAPDSAGVGNIFLLQTQSNNQSMLCEEAKMENKERSESMNAEESRRTPVRQRIPNHGLGKNLDGEDEGKVDEDVKIKKKKKKVEFDEIYAAEQKLKMLMDENKRRKSGQAHSLPSKYQNSADKSSEFQKGFSRSASLYRKLSTNASKPCSNVTKHNSEPNFNKVRRSLPDRLQSIIDLLTWRDVSRSTFVFLIGTFIIIPASCVQDLNTSLVSTVSYLGLSYLAVMFIYRSLINREGGEYASSASSQETVMSEEEAIRILKAALPYFNKFVSSLKALFSGDPRTTLKVAVPLFVLAQCGSCISFWNITVTGFFGLCTIPKLYALYCSARLTDNGENWIHRLVTTKNSCSKHKITIALISFFLVWNFFSSIARIWALFLVLVATRCYQQSMSMKK